MTGEITGTTVDINEAPIEAPKRVWPNKRTAYELSEKAREMHGVLASNLAIEVKHYHMGVFVQWCDEFASRLGERLPTPEGEFYS